MTIINLPKTEGGTGAVSSVNGKTGTVTLVKGDIGLGNVNNTSDVNKPVSTLQAAADSAVQSFSIQRANHTGTQLPNTIESTSIERAARFNSSGLLDSIEQYQVFDNGTSFKSVEVEPDNNLAGFNVFAKSLAIKPLQASPDETWNLNTNNISIDPDSSGFNFGTNGKSAVLTAQSIFHNGTSDIGSIEFCNNTFSLGNGTDAINVKGIGYYFGFGQVNANANINGFIQGYGFQLSVNSSASIDSSVGVNPFYDFANIGCPSPSYLSYSASPSIAAMMSTNSYTAFNCNANIPLLNSNSGFVGLNITPTLGTFNNNAYFNGVNIAPTITLGRSVNGINVTMDNVTVYAGVKSSLTIQDLTFEFILPSSFANGYTLEFTPGATAGSEVVSVSGAVIEIQIEDGVSTATQIKTACDAFTTFFTNITTTISGTASNPQTVEGPTNFSGGEDPGRKLAAYLDGDVEITGALAFGGNLSIGALNAFSSKSLVDTGGNPQSVHGLITQPTVAANATLTSADTIGVNTAALITIGDNASVSTAFVGIAALGLPAVVNMGTGSTVDRIYGALYALSLDASAAGGTIDEVGLCKATSIPNGTTTVNKLYGYLFDLPFGDPGTSTWGFYSRTTNHNYLGGDLLIGGTPGSDDIVTNSSVALEVKSTTKAMVVSRLTSSEISSLTAIDGMIVLNTTTNKYQGYVGGSWVDFH